MSEIPDNISSAKTVERHIDNLAFNGKAVGQVDGKITFFDAGLPGETVRAVLTKKKARYNHARVTEILVKSPYRVEAKCRHFAICGGCVWQDLDYEKQLFFKRRQVIDCLEHIGRLPDFEVASAIGSDNQFYYRNKMEFSANADVAGGCLLGLHYRGCFDRIFNVEECLLQSSLSNEIVRWFRDFVKGRNIRPYNVVSHEGFLRFLVIREGKKTGQTMLNIVTTEGDIPAADELCREAREKFPQIATIAHNVNNAKSNIAKGEKESVILGGGFIEEELFGYKFRLYANSFFQTNTMQAEKLYGVILDLLRPQKEERLLDLYCGTGTIGVCAAKSVARVIGVECEPFAVQAARENAAWNNISNIEFHIGAVQDLLADDLFSRNIDGIVIDPPRAGLHPKALKKIIEIKYPKIVYVSCNPATFARDAAILIQAGYRMSPVIPIDMFPHTMHIELAAGFYL
jgi:23S rRNA (uracil1939-C5)-methyltransferase